MSYSIPPISAKAYYVEDGWHRHVAIPWKQTCDVVDLHNTYAVIQRRRKVVALLRFPQTCGSIDCKHLVFPWFGG